MANKNSTPDNAAAPAKKSPFNFKEVSIGVEDLWKAEAEGDSIIGFLRKVGKMNTAKGETGYIEVNPVDENYDVVINPETDAPMKTTIFLSAGLANYPWAEYIGKAIQITYTGEQRNQRTGQTFKAFSVFIDTK